MRLACQTPLQAPEARHTLGCESNREKTTMTQQQTRRRMLQVVGASAVMAPAIVRAQAQQATPASVITTPPREFGPHGTLTTYFRDPDVLTVDPAFDALAQPNASIKRLWTGALWAEGPAWNSVGRYLIWSDIPNNRQM